MKALITCLLFLFTLPVYAYNFYLSNYKVYGTNEEVFFTLYSYNYRGNSGDIDLILYKVTDTERFFKEKVLSQYGQQIPDDEIAKMPVLKQWSESMNRRYNQQVSLGELEAGVYVIEGISDGEIAHIPIIVSDYSVIVRNTGDKAVVFMSNKTTGEQVKGFKSIAAHNGKTYTPDYYKGSTALYDFSKLGSNYYNVPLVAMKDDKVAVNQTYFYNYYYNQQNKNEVSYMFTDRSAYRPEQTIKFKGIFRIKEGFGYDIPSDSITYVIYDPQRTEVARKKVALDKLGTFNDSIQAEKSWKLGEYTISIGSNNNYYWYGQNQPNTCKFKIEEYKKPEFEVLVNMNESQYQTGDEITATINAKYFFGAPVTNATVEYKIVAEHYYVPWYYNYRYWWWYEELYGDYYSSKGGRQIIHHGTGKIKEDGSFEIKYKTENSKNQNYKYTVIAEVTDASRRVISGSEQAIVAYSSFNISANSQKYYYKSGEDISLEVNAFDFSRNRTEQKLNIELTRYDYDRRYWRKTGETKVMDTIITTSDINSTIVNLPSSGQGYYHVTISGEDKKNHVVSQNVSAYVFDPSQNNYYWWTQGSNSGIQIMTDKKVYNAGETVHAVVFLPHESDALVTVNGKEFAHFGGYEFKGSEEGAFKTFDIPIDADAYGRFEVYVGYNYDGNYYTSKQDINIIPDNKYLNVSLEFDKSEYRPGKTATATVKVTDNKGRPVPFADVTLSTADEAIYSLYPDQTKEISQVFYKSENFNFNYDYQNRFNTSSSSKKMPIKGLRWRSSKLNLSASAVNYLNGNQWYYYAYQENGNAPVVIRGYMVEKGTNKPIANGVIQVGNNKAYTKSDGSFTLVGFKLSHTNITFKHNGSFTKFIKLPLSQGYDVDLVVAVDRKEDKEIVMSHTNQVVRLEDNEVFNVTESEDLDMVMAEEESAEAAPAMDASVATGGASADMNGALAQTASVSRSANKSVAKKESSKDNSLKGEGQQQAQQAPVTVRTDFQDAIYWNPNLRTNHKGEAKVQIKLPDNLTTWRTFAKVITPDTKVGETVAKVVVTKNLLVRMETPRFMTLGDEMLIATTVHNYLGTTKTVTVHLESNGLIVEGTEQKITVDPHDDKRIDWAISTRFITEADLTVKATTDEESDAMKVKVPVQPHGIEMISASSMYLTNSDKQSNTLHIPDGINMNSAYLEISTAPSVTAALLTSMDDLIGYPYGCVEQTMSRFLPNVIVAQTIQTLGRNYNSTIDNEELKKMVAKGTERLGQLQHNDGGWGWWENDQTNPFMTAYVVNGLYIGKSAGHEIPEDMLARGINALSRIVTAREGDATTQAYAIMVASKVGIKNTWSGFDIPKDGNPYQYALLAQGAHYAKKTDIQNKMIALLEESAIVEGTNTYWGGKRFYYSWQDDRVETTANAILAISQADHSNKLLPGAIQWIMNQRKGKSWHNTRQTAMTIFGLNEIIKKDVNPNLELEILVNGVLIDKIKYTSKDVFAKGQTYTLTAQELLASTGMSKTEKLALLQEGDNKITVVQKGNGSLFVNSKLKYFLQQNSEHLEKEREKMIFKVYRTYYRLVPKQSGNTFYYEKEEVKENTFKSGENILVKVKIETGSPREYVLIEDPIPAGCEFIRDPKGYVVKNEPIYDGTDNYWNYRNWGYWNWNRWYSHRELRDSKISHTITNLPGGTYEYSYLMKAQIPGDFKVNPAVAQLMYYTENRGFSSFEDFSITE